MIKRPLRIPFRSLLLAGLLLGATSSATTASGQIWVTALSEQGRISVNGMLLEKLTSSFKKKKSSFLFSSTKRLVKLRQRWWNLTVEGSDRYAIRQDGKVSLNGSRLYDLAFAGLKHHKWVGVAPTSNGVWALRNDGRVSLEGSKAFEFAEGGNAFRRIASDGTNAYHMRTDGVIFRNDEQGSFYRFNAGGAEGESSRRTWRALEVDRNAGRLYALRADGKVVYGALDGSSPEGGVLIANEPFSGSYDDAKAYVDIAIRPDGRYFVLRGKGVVRGPESPDDPLVNLPGSPNNKFKQTYMRIVATSNEEFAALRRDGRMYTGTSGSAVVNLKKGRYRALDVSDQPPALGNVRNERPLVARCSAVAIEGQPVEIPIFAIDVDMPVGEPEIKLDPADLPPGATFDATTRSVSWASPISGNHPIRFLVSDGRGKDVRGRLELRVRAADTSPKNMPPDIARMKRVRAMARQDFELPVMAVDRDGDTLSYSVHAASLPEGASFDPATATLHWKPTYEQVGKHTVRFLVSDGTVTRARSVSLQVVAGLKGW